MTRTLVKALLAAAAIHAAILLLGGWLIFHPDDAKNVREDVELISDASPEKDKDKDKEKEQPKEKKAEQPPEDAVAQRVEEAPDLRELQNLETPVAAPALEPLSLAALESALDPGAADGGFGGSSSLSSGGRIGGTGTAPGVDLEAILSIEELDQKPRAVFQASPTYPLDLRRRGVQGTVHVVFLVNTDGRVLNPKVDKTTNPAFDQAALDAVKQWRFEAGTRNGEKVQFKLRVPITFSRG